MTTPISHAEWLADGAGAGPVRTVTITLTDAQIKALPSTPVEIVAAPGSGKALRFISALGFAQFSAGAYTNLTGGTGVSDSMQMALSFAATYSEWYSGVFGIAQDQFILFPPLVAFDTTAGMVLSIDQSKVNVENHAINLSMVNLAGALTGGDPANTLKVTVFYAVVDLG